MSTGSVMNPVVSSLAVYSVFVVFVFRFFQRVLIKPFRILLPLLTQLQQHLGLFPQKSLLGPSASFPSREADGTLKPTHISDPMGEGDIQEWMQKNKIPSMMNRTFLKIFQQK